MFFPLSMVQRKGECPRERIYIHRFFIVYQNIFFAHGLFISLVSSVSKRKKTLSPVSKNPHTTNERSHPYLSFSTPVLHVFAKQSPSTMMLTTQLDPEEREPAGALQNNGSSFPFLSACHLPS